MLTCCLPECPLDDAILQAVEGDNSQPAPRPQALDGVRQCLCNAAQLVVHRNAQRLQAAGHLGASACPRPRNMALNPAPPQSLCSLTNQLTAYAEGLSIHKNLHIVR